MNLVPSPEQEMLRDTARRLLARRYPFEKRRALAAGEGFDAETWHLFADQGWLALPLPTDHGGLGGDAATVAILAEELGRAAVLEPYVACAVLAGGLIGALATDEQKAALLPPLAEGRRLPALAHVERTGGHLMTVSTRTSPAGGGWTLTGGKTAVLHGARADLFLVSARTDADLGVFMVEPGAPGLTVSAHMTPDGGRSAELTLTATPALRLGQGDATEALSEWLDRANAAHCADAVGAMAALLDATLDHTKGRQQFGLPLAAFQALRHRMAEMALMVEEARGAALFAALASDAAPPDRARAVSGARARIGRLSRRLAQEAIQLHGAMGVSEEVPVGTWFKRLYVFENLWGSTRQHLARYAEILRAPEMPGRPLLQDGPARDGMSLTISPEDAAFRDEVRAFLASHLDEDARRAERLNTSFLAEPSVGLPWQRRLAAKGWAAPSWPEEHGGPGWSLTRRYIFDQECEQAGHPHYSGAGLKMIAPVLFRFGSDAQKAFYLPRILSGEDFWAQGYSEPGAGSDLAALTTRAIREGDHYIVNGTKIWSTLGHRANRMFALVRTDDTGRKQEGITFLLIDLTAPGITIRPIVSICGTHEFNQIFFDDVRVPVSDRVADEGAGWTVAKYLLEFERGGSFAGGLLRALYARLHRIAATPGPDGAPALDDPSVLAEFAAIGTDIDAYDMLELTAMSRLQSGENPGALSSSMLKIGRSRIRQALSELTASILGPDALVWEPHRPLHDLPQEDPLVEERRAAPAIYFNSRSQTIFGGSNEIQLEIIAKVLLG